MSDPHPNIDNSGTVQTKQFTEAVSFQPRKQQPTVLKHHEVII